MRERHDAEGLDCLKSSIRLATPHEEELRKVGVRAYIKSDVHILGLAKGGQ